MELSPAICERARLSRDARFDGRFFVAVKTTRIFCRPTCPVQPPLAKNVCFYPSAATALAAGYRPCLRCLPELAPGRHRSNSGVQRVDQALNLIESGFLDNHDTTTLAARLGITPRHLTREFDRHIGASPHQLAHTRRLLFAKQLLDESTLSVTDIAYASGFRSLRRFNSAVKDTWNRTPSQLRKQPCDNTAGQTIRMTLAYRPPLDWSGLLEFHRQRAIPAVESVDGDRYTRTIRIGDHSGWFSVAPAASGHRLELVAVLPEVRLLAELANRVRRMFDLDADPLTITAALAPDALLGPVLRTRPGLRIPGAWDRFEISVRAIVGQQISVAAARTLASRLVAAFGTSLHGGPADDSKLFPLPEALADAALEPLGLTRSRANTIRRLATEVASGNIDLLNADSSAQDLVRQLTALPGIGDWTAQYIALRSGLDPDAFPASDLGLLRAADDGSGMTAARLRARAQPWRPWRGYAAHCLWQRRTRTSQPPHTLPTRPRAVRG